MNKREYLGDGVYATFDGFQIWLSTQRDGVWERIAIEPGVYANLVEFSRRVWRGEMPQ